METYFYKGVKDGKFITGEVEARAEDEVASKLKNKGIEILTIKPKEEKGIDTAREEIKKKFSFSDRFTKVKKQDKVFLYKNLATMLKAGLPLPEIIEIIRESVDNSKIAEVMKQLKYDIESGSYISASLEKSSDIFGSNEIAMIRAGEVGGTLPDSFFGLYQDTEAEYKLQKDIKGALTYPVIILSILGLVGILMLVFVLPQLTSFFVQANIEVPTMTRITMAISNFAKENFLMVIVLVVAVVVGVRLAVKKSKAAKKLFDKYALKIPWVGKQVKLFYIYKFARMLSLLMKSGVPILEALDIVQKSVPHTGYSSSVKQMKKDVKAGGKLSDAVERFDYLYPAFVSRMLKVGDKTGNTSESLINISDYYREELQEALDNISTIIEPVLMVVLGVGVAFIAISVLIPLYSIVSGINQMKK